MNKKHRKHKKGFTLIELLVTTTIIVVLMSVGIVAYNQAGKSARDAKRKTDIEAVRQAMMLYRADEGVFPTGNGTNPGTNYDNLIAELIDAQYLVPPAPQDPLDTAMLPYSIEDFLDINVYAAPSVTYEYKFNGTPTAFCLCGPVEGDKGNSSQNAPNSSCPGIGSGTTYYCAKGF